MNKKTFTVVLMVLALLTINFSVAHEIDNSTSDEIQNNEILTVNDVNDDVLKESASVKTHMDVESNTTFDVIGDYFKIKLSDEDNKTISNSKVTFAVNGKNYTKTTDSAGIASLQINLNDGTYKITTKFAGNSNYKSSSLTTTINVNNTRVVEEGLSNSEIQKIIDNAKANNIILFKGNSYSNVNLIITKRLTLISKVNTALKSNSANPVITIKGKNANLTTVKGFNIDGHGDGIVIKDSDYVIIAKNEISTMGNGIVATGTKYLNITKNDIVKNSKSGIVLADTTSTYIFDNKISNNGQDGIKIAKSNKVYIHGNTISNNHDNGIHLTTTANGVNYKEGPKNLYINKNTISKNGNDGILINDAGDNLNIKSNNILSNKENGISISHIGSNTIKSNVITDNLANGIKFFDNYVKPDNQDISYNAIFFNTHMDVEAKDTYYQDTGNKLQLGDNWYSDFAGVCPKINTNNIKFTVSQIGKNKFQALFLDSNGNVASLLPDRTLTYTANNGKSVSITVSGGAAVFTVDANDNDLIKAVVDHSQRDNTYDNNAKSSPEINGVTPSYSYPDIPYDSVTGYGDGNGDGDGTGEGSGGNTNKGNGTSSQESSEHTGNSTHSQQAEPAKSANNQVNDVSQSYETQTTTSQASASDSGSGDASAGSQQNSVVKQIILDEEDIYRVTGISFIILLILLTVAFYYRDDIKEMNSKR